MSVAVVSADLPNHEASGRGRKPPCHQQRESAMCGVGISGARSMQPPQYASVAAEVNAAREAGRKMKWPPQDDVMERPNSVPRATQPSAPSSPSAPSGGAGPLGFLQKIIQAVMNAGQNKGSAPSTS